MAMKAGEYVDGPGPEVRDQTVSSIVSCVRGIPHRATGPGRRSFPPNMLLLSVFWLFGVYVIPGGKHYPKSAGRVVKRLPSAHLEQTRIPFANQVVTNNQ